MNRDEIMRMANETAGYYWMDEAHIQRFAALVAAAERAKCIDLVAMYGGPVDLEAAIRARGEKK